MGSPRQKRTAAAPAGLARRTRRRVGRVLGRLAVAVGGPAALNAVRGRAELPSHAVPKRFTVKPPPPPVGEDWPSPPEVTSAYDVIQSVDAKSNALLPMDVALLTQLNEEYRGKPLVKEPPEYDQESLQRRGRERLAGIHETVDLANKKVLELGCGSGIEVWYLAHQFGSDAWGVDVTERNSWAQLTDPKVHFVCADIGAESPFEADSFDRIYSVNVFEHVYNPVETLAELYRILRPGGIAWIRANLYRGPMASHLYRELFMPFPHLLFSDDVIAQYRAGTSGIAEGAAWVNRLSWAEYEDAFQDIGFVMRSLKFTERPLDEDFYRRFYHILGRYPKLDLTRDFFRVIAQKPA